MQIVVNTRLLLKDKLEGIGWFSYQTLKRITAANKDVHFVFLFDRNFDESFIFSDNITPIILQPQARHPFLYYLYFQFSVKSILTKLQPDLFLSPDGFLSLGANCAQLPVIHDINFLHHPQDSKWLTAKYYNYYFPKFAAAAARIATVSEYSKADISKNYNIDPTRIDVVYNGINEGFRKLSDEEIVQCRTKYSKGCPYFLATGALHPRKNIAHLIDAFSLFKAKSGSKTKLLLVGPSFWGTSDIAAALKRSQFSEEVLFTGRLPLEELTLVTGAAQALCMVSYYEGFGIPLVEAMGAEIPILSSTSSCLPEIAGNAAVYADPFEISQIADQLERLDTSTLLRSELITNGRNRKSQFSWDRSAALLWQSIEKTLAR